MLDNPNVGFVKNYGAFQFSYGASRVLHELVKLSHKDDQEFGRLVKEILIHLHRKPYQLLTEEKIEELFGEIGER